MLSLLENLASHFCPMMAQHNVNTVFEFVILDNLYFQIHLFQLLLIKVFFLLLLSFCFFESFFSDHGMKMVLLFFPLISFLCQLILRLGLCPCFVRGLEQ